MRSSVASAASMPSSGRIVVLHYYLGLPLADAAEALNMPLGTAKSRLFRARETLRAALDADSRAGRAWEGEPA